MSNEQNSRRDFFKKASVTGIAAVTIPFANTSCKPENQTSKPEATAVSSTLIVPKA